MGNNKGKNNHSNKKIVYSNNRSYQNNQNKNMNDDYEIELSKVIRNDENFDIKAYKNVESENKKARMTDEELRDSIVNYKVPELDIPDFSHGKSLKEDDTTEKDNLLDKLLTEEEPKKKKKNSKKDFREVELLGEEKIVEAKKEVKTEIQVKEEKNENANEKLVPRKNEVDEERKLAELAKKKQMYAAEKGIKTSIRKQEVKVEKPVKKVQPKKSKKKLKVGRLFDLLFRLIIIIVVLFLLYFGYQKIMENKNTIKISKNIPDTFGISDYTNAPLTNYGIYKTIPSKIRGAYISEYTISNSSNVDKWIEICKTSELNALVINVKNDDGLISFEVDYDGAHDIGADANRTIKDPAELTLKLKQNGIWPIARIVSFKDPYLASHRTDLALKNTSGSVLQVKSGSHYESWVNPYNKDLWDYVVEVSKCALDMGFKEIQYDYIRFGTGSEMSNASFGFDSATKSKRDIIIEFSKYAKEKIEAYGGYLAADVFGTIITSDYDAEIVGQNYLEMSKIYDFICPMIYPSHYANGSLGVEYPDLDPYNLVKKALEASNNVISNIPTGEHRAIVRAWLQDFTATWVSPHQTYGSQQIREQKQAVYDSGNTEWLLWNASNKYSTGGLD